MTAIDIAPASGRLGVLTPGMGAVATTFYAGVLAARAGFAQPIGSLTQLGHIRLGKRTDDNNPLIRDFAPLASLDQLAFGGWDPYSDDAYAAAMRAGVLRPEHLEAVGEELRSITPMPAVFSPKWVSRLDDTDNTLDGASHLAAVESLVENIAEFRTREQCDRLVMVWCGSTEAYHELTDVHSSLEAFEKGLAANDPNIAPSQLYAYAALTSGVPFANGAPNFTVDVPAIVELAQRESVPIAGKDFKTGQTLMKTIIAPGLKTRMLGIKGWYSTNILGNRDGEVLDDPENFRSKEVSKLGVLEQILQPELYPDLYEDLYHMVRINYYPPRGDDKEGWDNIDIFGWLGYPMQIKIDFLCKDSILAAPLVLDLALLMDLAARAGKKGVQEWLSFYFKSPQTAPGLYAENDIFIQLTKLKNTLRHWMGEDMITHLGSEYYDD
ncbi:MAG: inositol-3-phosphate synthase [Acidimicrobiia bacterium]|nr:inositol-3-phosphate synthase [Acidimicrobiia bacterium]MDH5292154.1 inositol-3-phosphate synthase [Acidimicrobiia bacterium]MDH5522089.1 inositol-3-phosphate synthase [Acidimicrobiia bacterium]